MRRAIVGTAGHIDHGKTALVAALTGEDTDRLPEEQRRGISIDLGFSHLEIDDRLLGIVDVPGHEDFIRNMMAGASGIDLLLLVVAADEGVMPQTREHVAIAQMLGVPEAVVALTKTDLVEPAWLELARDDVAEFLGDTEFADAQILPVSATTGRGLEALRDAIGKGAASGRGRADDLFRLPIDRSFTVRGTGTVVTGTVWSGSLEPEQHVRLMPGGVQARVRGLQVHGEETAQVTPGMRAAVALAGVDREAASRGLTLVTDEAWQETLLLTARLRILPGSTWSVEQRQRVRVHLGTAEVMARVAILDRAMLGPGDAAWAQLRLETPLVARAGDRFVVRSYSPVTTIGGGIVVEPAPGSTGTLEARDRVRLEGVLEREPVRVIRELLESAGGRGRPAGRLPLETGLTPARVAEVLETCGLVIGERVFAPGALERVRDTLTAAVDRHHQDRPLQPGLDPAELRRAPGRGTDAELVEHALKSLVDDSVLAMRRGRVGRVGFEPVLTTSHEQLRTEILRSLEEEADAPPRLDELRDRPGVRERLEDPRELLDLLELMDERGEVVRVEHDLFMAGAHIKGFIDGLRTRFGGRSDLSPSDLREVVPLSRQYLIPVLEYMDRIGVTARGGNGREVLPGNG